MRKIVTSVIFITIGMFTAKAGTQGEAVKATINEHMVITLPADQALAEHYVIDISTLNFASDAALQQFIDNFSENNFKMTGSFSDKKITVDVTPFRDSTGHFWDAAKWNEYLSGRAPKMEMFMQTMNK